MFHIARQKIGETEPIILDVLENFIFYWRENREEFKNIYNCVVPLEVKQSKSNSIFCFNSKSDCIDKAMFSPSTRNCCERYGKNQQR